MRAERRLAGDILPKDSKLAMVEDVVKSTEVADVEQLNGRYSGML